MTADKTLLRMKYADIVKTLAAHRAGVAANLGLGIALVFSLAIAFSGAKALGVFFAKGI